MDTGIPGVFKGWVIPDENGLLTIQFNQFDNQKSGRVNYDFSFLRLVHLNSLIYDKKFMPFITWLANILFVKFIHSFVTNKGFGWLQIIKIQLYFLLNLAECAQNVENRLIIVCVKRLKTFLQERMQITLSDCSSIGKAGVGNRNDH